MSSINRGKRDSDGLKSVAAIAIVFLIAAAGIIVWGYSKQAEYYRDADEHSYEYARNTYAPEANRCVVLPLEAQFDCIAKASDEYRKYRRDEYDLVAQKTSALWSYLMGSAAVIGMILSAFGVFLVWRTLVSTNIALGEAQKTSDAAITATNHAKEANDIMKGEQRPWLNVSVSFPDGVNISRDSVDIVVVPIIRNLGARPAHDVWVEIISALPGADVLTNITTQFGIFVTEVHNRRTLNPFVNGSVIFPNDVMASLRFPTVIEGDALAGLDFESEDGVIIPHIFCCCVYRDRQRGDLLTTAQSYMLTRRGRKGSVFIRIKDGVGFDEQIIRDQTFQPNMIT